MGRFGRLWATLLLIQVLAASGLATQPAAAQPPWPRTIDTAAGWLHVAVFARDLHFPWSVVVLPDGGMLVSEKHPGRLRRVSQDGTVGPPLAGLPPIYAEGNGGLLGLALDPEFRTNSRLFFAFAEPGADGTAGIAVARATLGRHGLHEVTVIFRQQPKVADVRNFGGRLVFAPDGTLFVTAGDRFAQHLVQDRRNTLGVVARIETDGGPPPDNPFVGEPDVDPVIWSWGHRNVLGAAIHPESGALWTHELGPRGGDELNVPAAGRNHGWPLVSWGRHYTDADIPDPPTRPDLAPSIYHWTPSISPSGMVFYDGAAIPEWRGNLLLGGLSSQRLTRLTLRGDRVISEERIELGVRIRDVAQGADGAVYLLTDAPDGKILRLTRHQPERFVP